MRKARKTTFTVVLCAAVCAANSALADPASMALKRPATNQQASSSIWPWSKKAETAPPAPQQFYAQPPAKPSLVRHPIEYFKSVKNGKSASAPQQVMPPAGQKSDPISLNTPVGPPTPEFFILAAQLSERQGDIGQARANFQRALAMWPGHVEVLRAAARMEDRQNNLPVAESLYGQAVASNPQHAGALNDLGLCLARQGKLQASEQVLEQAVQLQPTKTLYRNNAATVLVEMHQDQRALAHLAAVHGPADANYNLGQLLVERGRGADAVPYFQAALQQNPNMQPAQEALAKLQATKMAAAPRTAAVPPIGQAIVTPAPQPMAQLPPGASQQVLTQQPAPRQAVPQQTIPPQQAMPQQNYAVTPATQPAATQPYAYATTPVTPVPAAAPGAQVAPVAQQPNYAAAAPQQPVVNQAPAVTPQYLPPVASRPGVPGAIVR